MSVIIVYLPVPVQCSTPKAASELLARWAGEKARMLEAIERRMNERPESVLPQTEQVKP